MREQLALAPGVDGVRDLRHQLYGRVAAATSTVTDPSMKEPASLRISSGKVAENSKFWRFTGRQGEDLADVVDEAHVEHPVGFVEHQDLDLAQIDRFLLHVNRAAGRRGDQNVDAAAQRVACGCMPTPPYTQLDSSFTYLRSAHAFLTRVRAGELALVSA